MPTKFLIAVACIIILIYLNRAYSYFYSYLGEFPENPPSHKTETLVTNGKGSGEVTYMAIGDSLTAGVGVKDYKQSYPYLLAQNMPYKSVKLVDLADPGATTTDVINNKLPQLSKYSPDIITLLIGVNDIHNLYSTSKYQNNMSLILDKLKQTNAKIYLISLPYLGSSRIVLFPYNFILDFRTKQFNNILSKLALEKGVKYIDLYSFTNQQFKTEGDFYSDDQFHPSSGGYSSWIKVMNVN